MTSSPEEMNSIHYELEQAQLALVRARGTLPPFDDSPWVPVGRMKATDTDIDKLVENSEQELEVLATTSITDKAKVYRKSVNIKAKKRNSKIKQARAIYKANNNLTRQEIIKKFIHQIGLSVGTANTYYHVVKKGNP